MARTANPKPRTRKTNARSLVMVLEGAEKPYPVYQFSGGNVRLERPNKPLTPPS